jgi:hypothetical protein
MRNTDTSAAVAANRLRKQKRWAEEMRSDGWLVQQYPMDPQHYGDTCETCDRRQSGSHVCKPHALVPQDGGGLLWAYRCPLGHAWTCWYGPQGGYFSGCMCAWCADGRLRDGAKTWPRAPFYNAEQS